MAARDTGSEKLSKSQAREINQEGQGIFFKNLPEDSQLSLFIYLESTVKQPISHFQLGIQSNPVQWWRQTVKPHPEFHRELKLYGRGDHPTYSLSQLSAKIHPLRKRLPV